MFVQFSNEVLARGPRALLPQNLNTRWLGVLQEMSDAFINHNFDLHECKTPEEAADPLLAAAVDELARANGQESPAEQEMMEKITLYALALTMETVRRETSMPVELPTVDTIFSWDRILRHQEINCEFIELLEKACLFKPAGKGFFERIKEKLHALRHKQTL